MTLDRALNSLMFWMAMANNPDHDASRALDGQRAIRMHMLWRSESGTPGWCELVRQRFVFYTSRTALEVKDYAWQARDTTRAVLVQAPVRQAVDVGGACGELPNRTRREVKSQS